MMPFDEIKEFLWNNNRLRIVWTSNNGFAVTPIRKLTSGRNYSNKISDIVPINDFSIRSPVKYIEWTYAGTMFAMVTRVGDGMSYRDIRNEHVISEFQKLYVKEYECEN